MSIPIPVEAPAGVVPRDNTSIGAMLTQIMGRLSEAERKTLYSASVSQGGLTVQDGGAMRLRLDNGVDVFYAGPLHYDDPVVNYNGIIMRRPDGTPIFYTFPPGGDPNVIAWRFLDQDRNEVVASDAVTGGLAKPWIPITGVPMLSSAIPMTSNAGFIGTWATGSVPKQQPYVEVQALIRSESGGIGNARYTMNGTPVGSSMPIASGAFGWQSIQVLPLPGDFYTYISIELEVQRTNATGSVGGVFRGFQRQT